MSRRSALATGLAALVVALAPTLPVGAQEGERPGEPAPVAARPRVAVEPGSAAPGQAVVLAISGFRTHNVTVTVCGNAAARGSVDCNQAAGEAMGLPAALTRREHRVEAPPTPCPCLVRVASRTQDEVAIAPLEVVGHPVAAVVRSDTSRLVDVSIEARRAPASALDRLRSALGGPTAYEVEVTVQNRSGLPLSEVSVTASARRGGDGVAAVDLPAVGSLAPGATWSQVAPATVPAPVLGPLAWEATAAGAGPAVSAATSSRPVPYLLLVLVALLAGDVVAMLTRRATRSARTRRLRPAPVPA